MKKIVFYLVVLSIPFKVDALEMKNFYYRADSDRVCDEVNSYPIYIMQYKGDTMYFLNPSVNYNLNFEDYEPVSFEDSSIPENIQYFSGSNIVFGGSTRTRAIHRILWERLYPDKKFHMCYGSAKEETYYQDLRKIIYEVYEGPEFAQKILCQDHGKEYEYEYEYLNYFEIKSSDGIDAIIENNILKIKGESGKYQIILKRKGAAENDRDLLFTDGTNYLLWFPAVNNQEYVLNVVIKSQEVTFVVKDDKGNVLNDTCFLINDENLCTNDNGQIYYNPQEEIIVTQLNNHLDIYENYNNIWIAKNNNYYFEIILINKSEEEPKENIFTSIESNEPEIKDDIVIIEPNEKESVIIEVKDTMTLATDIWGMIYMVIFCGVVKKD